MSKMNLFARVPKLGLPKPLQSYVLFDVSLDDENNAPLTTTKVFRDESGLGLRKDSESKICSR